MNWMIYGEVRLFAICLAIGVFLAFIYDLFRILRILFHHSDFVVDMEDLGFWLLTAWMVFQTLFQYNEGALRAYAFIGMFLGVILYTLTLSRLLLFLVKKGVPYWEKGKAFIKKPFHRIKEDIRKALKNMVVEVKMAIKGR